MNRNYIDNVVMLIYNLFRQINDYTLYIEVIPLEILMAKKSYKSLEADYKKLLAEKNAKSVTTTKAVSEQGKNGKFHKVPCTTNGEIVSVKWRADNYGVGIAVTENHWVKLNSNETSGSTNTIARNMEEFDNYQKEERKLVVALMEKFDPYETPKNAKKWSKD